MSSSSLIRTIAFLAIVSTTPSGAPAQALSPCPGGTLKDVSGFIDSRIQKLKPQMTAQTAQMTAQTKAQVAQKNNTNQTQLPSISVNSPSLVDQSSASDLVGVGLNLIGVGSSSKSPNTTSTSATVSAYALRAALSAQDPLQTEYYNANSDWRRLFITLGVDYPQQGSGAEAERGVIVGGKFLLYNERDITKDPAFGRKVEDMLEPVGVSRATALKNPVLMDALKQALCSRTDGEFVDESKLNLDAIDETLKKPAVTASQYQSKAADLVKEVNNRPQVAIEFLTTQRKGQAANDYMGVLTGNLGWQSDLGFADSIALTMNGGYDFKDQPMAKDSQGGKFGAEIRLFQASKELDRRVPWTVSIAGDGKWMTNTTPEYRAQGVFTIALFNGVDLPLSVSWANKSEFVQESQVIGNVGFTVDIAKLAASLRQ